MKKCLFIIALVAVAWVLIGWLKPTEYRTEYKRHTVTAGQTVWGIATKYQPLQDKKMSVGELVHKIYKVNGIDPRLYIQPDDVLIIPLEQEVRDGKQ